MTSKAKIIMAAIITMASCGPVRSFALAHGTQFNAGTVIIMFAVALGVLEMFSQLRGLFAACDMMAEMEDDE